MSSLLQPTSHNPHARRSLFLGSFRSGCPQLGLLVEFDDAGALTVDDFSPDRIDMFRTDIHKPNSTDGTSGAKSEATTQRQQHWQVLLAQKARTYHVTYDGSTAFWQTPVPLKMWGLFDVQRRLSEFEVREWVGGLNSAKALEAWWYRWTPMLQADIVMVGANKNRQPGDGREAKPVAAFMPPPLPKSRLHERFYFLGLCVRNRAGLFPCPAHGVMKMRPATWPQPSENIGRLPFAVRAESEGGVLEMLLPEFKITFDESVCFSENPSPHTMVGEMRFDLPAGNISSQFNPYLHRSLGMSPC